MKRIVGLLLLIAGYQAVNAQTCAKSLHFDTTYCATSFSKSVDATVLKTRLCGDSITITFNAAGTPLAGDTNVYFHSGPEFRPFSGWQLPYTVGTFTANNGVGRMTNIGTNLWSIRINPRTYYGYPIDSCLNSIFCVFRNYNGTISAKNNGNDINLYTVPNPPTSGYANISGVKTQNNAVSYLWNDNVNDSIRVFTTGGNYSVTATGVGGCTALGTVSIKTGHAAVSLGADIKSCTLVPQTLHAGSGFATYQWLTGNAGTSSTYIATKPGCYWVKATDSVGCVSYDTLTYLVSDVRYLSIPDTATANACQTSFISVDATAQIEQKGDSLVIVYDATKGQTGLVGATKVYFHSGPEFHPFQGWQLPYTVGTFTNDDGIGKMDSLGNNKWRIAIDPYCYYHINPDTSLNGIFMVFRNYNGTQTGKDSSGNNIYLSLSTPTPTSAFNGVYGFHKSPGTNTYAWSSGSTAPNYAIDTAGLYVVTVTDGNGCTASDSINVVFNNNLTVNIGHDTSICTGQSLVLNPGAGYSSTHWSTGDTTQSITVSGAATISIIASQGNCVAYDTIKVTTKPSPVVAFNPDTIKKCHGAAVTLNAGIHTTYNWNTGATADTLVVTTPSVYTVTVTNSAGCAAHANVTVVDSVCTVACQPPHANFTVGSITPFNSVTIIDSSFDHTNTSYHWIFGDGTTTNDTGSVVHTYLNSGNYTVKLVLMDSCGKDSLAKTISVNATGINNLALSNSVNIYPNPANEILHVQVSIPVGDAVVCTLRNMVGETLGIYKINTKQGETAMDINVSTFAQGMYLIELSNETERTFKKLIINR